MNVLDSLYIIAEVASDSRGFKIIKIWAHIIKYQTKKVVQHVITDSYKTFSTIESLANGIEVSRRPVSELSGRETLSELVPFLLDASEHLTTVRKWIPEQPDLESTAPHMFFGELPCKAWFLFLRLHDTDHLNQIKTLKNELHIS